MTVLWGARRGDVQYASYDWRCRNIPIGAARLAVVSSLPHFRPGDVVQASSTRQTLRVVGVEGAVIGVEPAA